MAFPGPKVHRPSRRKLGRGQYPVVAGATVTVTAFSADVASLVFSQPMVISGPVNFTVTGLTPIAQTAISPTEVRQSYAVALSTHTWTFAANQPGLATSQGGGVVAATGTF